MGRASSWRRDIAAQLWLDAAAWRAAQLWSSYPLTVQGAVHIVFLTKSLCSLVHYFPHFFGSAAATYAFCCVLHSHLPCVPCPACLPHVLAKTKAHRLQNHMLLHVVTGVQHHTQGIQPSYMRARRSALVASAIRHPTSSSTAAAGLLPLAPSRTSFAWKRCRTSSACCRRSSARWPPPPRGAAAVDSRLPVSALLPMECAGGSASAGGMPGCLLSS